MPSAEAGTAAAGHLALASWNVHAWVGADGRRDPARAARVIAKLACDVVLLQEVEERDSPRGRDGLQTVAAETGHDVVRGPVRRAERVAYGNALLTRLRVLAVHRVDLSVPGREPRGALDVELEAAGERLRVIGTHLGLARHERHAQVARLLALGAECDAPLLVLAGDLNDWAPLGGSVGALDRALGRSPAPRTFPARRPVLALDRLWVRPARALAALGVDASPAARAASDHLPLRAELRLGGVD